MATVANHAGRRLTQGRNSPRNSPRRLWRLHTKRSIEHGNRVLTVEGRIGHDAADELEAVLSHTSDGVSTVVIDLSGVDYLSSAAVKVFQSGADRLSQKGGQLRLRAPSVAARFALELSGLVELIDR